MAAGNIIENLMNAFYDPSAESKPLEEAGLAHSLMYPIMYGLRTLAPERVAAISIEALEQELPVTEAGRDSLNELLAENLENFHNAPMRVTIEEDGSQTLSYNTEAEEGFVKALITSALVEATAEGELSPEKTSELEAVIKALQELQSLQVGLSDQEKGTVDSFFGGDDAEIDGIQ